MPKATNAHNLHTVDLTHVVYACFTSTAQSIEGGSLEVTLHQLASHLSFHLLPGWGHHHLMGTTRLVARSKICYDSRGEERREGVACQLVQRTWT